MAQEKRTIANSKEKASAHFASLFRHALSRKRWHRKSTDLSEKLRQKVKKASRRIRLFQFLSEKHTKTGRFGRMTAPDRADTIQNLDTAEDMPIFFDPFQRLDTDLTGSGTIESDFYQRVQEEMDLAEESDFERKNILQDEKDRIALDYAFSLGLQTEETIAANYSIAHDASKAFTPDEKTDTSIDPDAFELELSVMKPHELYLEYTQTKTSMRKKKLGGSVDDKTVLLKLLENDASFQELVARKRVYNPQYDPAKDKDSNSTINQILQNTSLAMREVGHSFVRMVAKGRGRTLSRYSFGFWPLTRPVMGSVTEGEVINPDPDRNKPNVITKNYPLKYSDYLRAAARIRGIMGTSRSYSFTGYNCTSFAVEVAQAAGISISDQDSSIDIPTMVSKSQRVEMPAALQRFIERDTLDAGAAKVPPVDRLKENPFFRSLYSYHGKQLPKDIPAAFLNALQFAVQNASAEKLSGLLPTLDISADITAVREAFLEQALQSEEVLKNALGLGIDLPEYSTQGNQLLHNTDAQKMLLQQLLSQSMTVVERYQLAPPELDLPSYTELILKQIVKKASALIDTLDRQYTLPKKIQSSADAKQLKKIVIARQKAFFAQTRAHSFSEYIKNCCQDEDLLSDVLYELQFAEWTLDT